MHKAGYVNIIGRPNVGKSTLMNHWVGEKLSIISPKAQTTRHRVLGIVNDEQHQLVFSDTPGIIFDPANKLHISMNEVVAEALTDADVIIYLAEMGEKPQDLASIIEKIKNIPTPKILLLNKCDTSTPETIKEKYIEWEATGVFQKIFAVSALEGIGTKGALDYIYSLIPESPPYFPKDQITDRNTRFYVSEIIREKILLNYKQEIPYSVQVVIESYKEKEDMDVIKAVIYTERESQKAIIIGDKGISLKKIGMAARTDIEKLIDKKVFLELFVKVKDKWRDNETLLKNFGY